MGLPGARRPARAAALEHLARRAAAACPTLALRLRADRLLNVSTQGTAGSVPAPPRPASASATETERPPAPLTPAIAPGGRPREDRVDAHRRAP